MIIVFEDPNKIPPAGPAPKKPCNGNENENETKEETPPGQADEKESANHTEAKATAETAVDKPAAANGEKTDDWLFWKPNISYFVKLYLCIFLKNNDWVVKITKIRF